MGSSLSQKAFDSIRAAKKDKADELYLKECKLKSVPVKVCDKFKHCKKIVFSKNAIEVLPGQIGKFQSLQILLLDSNELSWLPTSTLKLKSLQVLNVSWNHLNSLPEPFSELIQLSELDIGGNRFEKLSGRLKDCAKLETLKVYSNLLNQIPSSIFNCKQIKVLDISGNRITEIPDQVGTMIQLVSLNISKNPIHTLNPHISSLYNLQDFDCSSTEIETLDKFPFNPMNSLRQLNFNNCRLKLFSCAIDQLVHLENLDLCHNKLTSLPPTIGHIGRSLQKLNLANNELKTLPGELSMLDTSIILKLEGNELKQLHYNAYMDSTDELFRVLMPLCSAWGPSCFTEGECISSSIKNRPSTFKIIARDYLDRPLVRGGGNFEVKIYNDEMETSIPCQLYIKDCRNGTYIVSYKMNMAGHFKILITHHDKPLANSPSQLIIHDQ